MKPLRRWGGLVAAALLMAACGDTPTMRPLPGVASALRTACGERVIVQTDWFPEPEHAALYQLAGTTGTLDKERGRYAGEITGTGVVLEVRAGGPFLSNQTVTSLMYAQPEILLGYVNTDSAVLNAATQPVVGVATPLEKSPQILMWDAAKYDFEKPQDIGETDVTVLYFEGVTYMEYFIAKGWIKRSQADGSYKGSPTRFVAEGDLVQQGFATNELYYFEHPEDPYGIKEWGGKKLDYLLVHDSGLELYPEALSVRKDDVAARADCLKLLVPLIQQAQVNYMSNPEPVNDKLVEIVDELGTFWKLSDAGNAEAVRQMLALGIVSNGPDATLGNFDEARVQRVIDELVPVFGARNVQIKPNLQARDIVTNGFIDPSIRL